MYALLKSVVFNYYVILILSLDEDADLFEEILVEVSQYILINLTEEEKVENLPYLFNRISAYPSLNQEQLLALIYQDEVKRMILDRLEDEGMVAKSELSVWLKDQYSYGFVDLESTLTDLIKKGLVKGASVRGMISDYVFLTKVITIIRAPSIELYKTPEKYGLPPDLSSDYRNEVRKFFSNYSPSEEDNITLAKILIDPQCYEVFKLLRQSIVRKEDLTKLKKKGVEDTDDVLRKLYEAKLLQVFQDKKKIEYYALLSDIKVDELLPYYILNTVITSHNNKTKTNQVLIEYLDILENTFIE